MTTEKYPLTTQDKVWFEGWYDFTIEGFNYYTCILIQVLKKQLQ